MNNNNNNSLIYIVPYAELRRRWTTVNQAAVNKNVFRCFLKTESELQSRMFDGRLFQILSRQRNAYLFLINLSWVEKSVVSFGTVSRGSEAERVWRTATCGTRCSLRYAGTPVVRVFRIKTATLYSTVGQSLRFINAGFKQTSSSCVICCYCAT